MDGNPVSTSSTLTLGQDGTLYASGNLVTIGSLISDPGATILNIPVIRNSNSLLGTAPQQFVIATTPCSSDGTFYLDTSQLQLNLLTQNGESIITTEDLSKLANLNAETDLVSTCTTSIPTQSLLTSSRSIISEIRPSTNKTSLLIGASAAPDIQPPIKKGPFPCEYCDAIFEKYGQFQRHQKRHDDDKPHRCTTCKASFNVESNLILHMATHDPNNLSCPECHKKFSRHASFKSHIMLHQKEEILMCSECGEEFLTQNQLDKHHNWHKEDAGVAVFTCRFCRQMFTSLSDLNEHIVIHKKTKIPQHSFSGSSSHKRTIDRSRFHHHCSYCPKSFQKPSQLERHNRIHTGEKPYSCEDCGKCFNQKGALQIHMTKHSGARPHKCQSCPASFAQKGNLRAHIERVHAIASKSDIPLFSCDECSCLFKKLATLNAHISRTHHNSHDMSITIEEGQDDSSDNSAAQVANQTMRRILSLSENHDNNGSTEQCSDQNRDSECLNSDILQQALLNSGLSEHDKRSEKEGSKNKNKSTLSNSNLSNKILLSTFNSPGYAHKHVVRKVGGVRWHQCMYCVKEFKKPSDLVRHIRIHTHEKPFKCHLCYRAFAVKSTLTAHFRSHTGIKQYECTLCNKLFSTQGSLKVHLRLHTGSKPFNCTQCGRTFRTSGHRKSHMLSHTREASGATRTKRVRGPSYNTLVKSLPDIPLQEPIHITESGYTTVEKRSSSDMICSAERPYKCTMCSHAFKKSSHLKQHQRSHTGEKPYVCNQCNRGFVSSGVLKAHIRTHTGVKEHQCPSCSSTFTTNGSLKRHQTTHSENRPYICPYCEKTFKTAVNCRKHMKIHKPELAAAQVAAEKQNASIAQQVQDQQDITQVIQSGTTVITTNIPLTQDGLHQLQAHHHGSFTDATLGTFDQFEQLTFTTPHFTVQNGQIQGSIDISSLNAAFGQQTVNITSSEVLAPSENQIITSQLNHTSLEESLAESVVASNHQVGHLTLTTDSINGPSLVGDSLTVDPRLENIMEDENASAIISLPNPPDRQVEEYVQEEIDSQPTFSGPPKHTCEHCDKEFKKSSDLKQHLRIHSGERRECPHCNRVYCNRRALKYHIKKSHNGSRNYKCMFCEITFSTQVSLSRHLQTHQNEENKSQVCHFCDHVFRSSSLLKRHMKLNHNVDIGTDSESPPKENNSILKLDSKRNRSIVPLSLEETTLLARRNPDKDASVSEKVLLASAAEMDRISEIKKNAVPMNHPQFPHQCDHCPKSFKKPSDLVRHIRIHTGEKPYACDVCDKKFAVKSTLDSHYKTHGGEKEFKCHMCDSPFATKGSLKVHMRLHTGVKPFKCSYCELRFRTSGHRKSHMQVHLRGGSSKKRKIRDTVMIPQSDPEDSMVDADDQGNLMQIQMGPCIQIANLDPSLSGQAIQITPSMFEQLQQTGNLNITINPSWLEPQTSELLSPTNELLGEEPNSDTLEGMQQENIIQEIPSPQKEPRKRQEKRKKETKGGPHVCNHCTKSFKKPSQLERHLRIHTGERPFICEMCPKAFNQKNALQVHMKKHSGEKPWQCFYCNTSFTQKSNLKTHIRRVHREIDDDEIVMEENLKDVTLGEDDVEDTSPLDFVVELFSQDGVSRNVECSSFIENLVT